MLSKREQLIQTAVDLFSQHGYHATGIDRIAEEAGVTKRTMYRHFRSKEELILAALRDHDTRFRNEFMATVESRWQEPYDRLLGIFEVAQDWFSDNKFYGCMFINAVGEYSEPNTAIREVCKEFKRLMYSYILKLVDDLKVSNAVDLAEQLALLLEGAIVTAQVSETPAAAKSARLAAKVLVDTQLGAGCSED